MAVDDFVSALQGVVGQNHVLLASPDHDLTRYTTDWTGRFVGTGTVVVRPGSHDEVVDIVRICRRFGMAIVPQGGNTGLVGGSVPLNGEVVVSLTRLNWVGEVDLVSRQIAVGAGATLAEVHEAAAAVGLRYPVDFGARGSATVGGMVATNAGGISVLRFGPTRHQLRGHTVVLGDGSSITHMTGLIKDNTGYDLVGLLCGSEGTLGIVTSALLQLVPAPQSITTILVGCRDVESAVALVTQLTQLSQGIEAAEMMLKSGVDLVEQAFGFQAPWPAAVYVLLDIDAEETHTDELLSAIATSSGVTETAIGSDSSSRQRLWRLRDEHTPAISTLGPPLKFDITIPISRIDHFIATVTELLAQRFAEVAVFIFGHIADGNLHVNISGVDEADVDKVVQLVLGLVSERQGSISAEHGIGTAKKAYLHLSRSATDIAAMRGIKGALDPDGIMNPNVLFVD